MKPQVVYVGALLRTCARKRRAGLPRSISRTKWQFIECLF
jgi:hypothetical protein